MLWIISGMSFTKMLNNIGPRMLPCSMPLKTAASFDNEPLIDTLWAAAFVKLSSQWTTYPFMLYAGSLWIFFLMRDGIGVFTEIQVNAVNAVNTVSSTYKTMFRFGEEVVCH